MNAYDETLLIIHESCDEGIITETEKKKLVEKIKDVKDKALEKIKNSAVKKKYMKDDGTLDTKKMVRDGVITVGMMIAIDKASKKVGSELFKKDMKKKKDELDAKMRRDHLKLSTMSLIDNDNKDLKKNNPDQYKLNNERHMKSKAWKEW